MANVTAYIGLAAIPLFVITIAGIITEYLRYAMTAGVGACLVVNTDDAEAVLAPVPAPPKADVQPEAKTSKAPPLEEKSDTDTPAKDT